MSEQRFTIQKASGMYLHLPIFDNGVEMADGDVCMIEELQVSDEMGWKRAERFEKKCQKELHNKMMYIKRLEYKVQKFKEENEQLKHYKLYEDNKRLQTIIADLKEENEQLKRQNKALKDNSLTDGYFNYLENSRTVTLKVAEEQETYEHILKEFVDYCNERPRTSRADHLESLLISFLHSKMERYNQK